MRINAEKQRKLSLEFVAKITQITLSSFFYGVLKRSEKKDEMKDENPMERFLGY